MLFSIIIPTYGRKQELSRCLESIARQTANFEVIVMDQNPREFGLGEACAQFGRVLHVLSPVKGLSFNRNRAMELAKGDWILFADDDCVLGDGYLARAEAVLAGRQDVQAAYFTDVRNLEDGEFYTFPLTEADESIGYRNFKKIPSIGFIFSRKAVVELGGFDESLGIGARYGSGEDTDILLRALGRGIPVRRLHGCSIFHPKMSKSPSLERCRNYALGYGALFAKHLLIQPWRRKPAILATWSLVLFRNLGGILLNVGRPSKRDYYWNSLLYKAKGHADYLLRHPAKAGAR